MFYIWIVCTILFIVFSSVAMKQGLEEEKGKTFKSSTFFAAGNFIFFFISIFIPLVSKKVYWAWGLIPVIFRTPLGFIFYLPVWYFWEKFKSNKTYKYSENKKTIFIKELFYIKEQFEQQTDIYIPQVFELFEKFFLKVDDNELYQQNPQQTILNFIGDFCYRKIDFDPETKIYPGVLSLYGSQLKELYLFCVNLSFKKGYFTKEEYDMALTNLQLAIKDRNNA